MSLRALLLQHSDTHPNFDSIMIVSRGKKREEKRKKDRRIESIILIRSFIHYRVFRLRIDGKRRRGRCVSMLQVP